MQENYNRKLLRNFYKCGLNSAPTIDELHELNHVMPDDPLFEGRELVDVFIDRANTIAKNQKEKEELEKIKQKTLEEFEDRLALLQYRLTEVTTHHWTNKRKRQIRSIVSDTFPELEIRQYTAAEVKKINIDPRD